MTNTTQRQAIRKSFAVLTSFFEDGEKGDVMASVDDTLPEGFALDFRRRSTGEWFRSTYNDDGTVTHRDLSGPNAKLYAYQSVTNVIDATVEYHKRLPAPF